MPPPQTTFDPVTGQWKTQYYQPEIKTVEANNGTFKRTGKSILIEFPDYIITATVKDNVMSGEMRIKTSDEKIKWTAVKDSQEKDNSPKSPTLGETTGAKDLDLDTPLLSTAERERLMAQEKEQNRSQSNSSSSEILKTGNYEIFGSESITTGFAGTLKDDVTFYIKIESVTANGDVKGVIYKSGGDGKLKGKVDANGNLQLQGYYVDSLRNQWNFKLTATVDDDTLTEGNYEGATSNTSYKATFNLGRLKK